MARKLNAQTASESKPRRGRKPKAEGNGAAPAPAASNVPDEVVKLWAGKAIAADAEFQTAKEAMDSKRGAYRAILKSAGEAGCDKDAIAWLVKSRKREIDEIDRETRARNRIAKIMGLPIGTQLGLFEDGDTVAAKVDAERLKSDGEGGYPFAEGRQIGLAGRAADCPYPANSREAIEWLRGWDDGQFQVREKLGSGDPAATH